MASYSFVLYHIFCNPCFSILDPMITSCKRYDTPKSIDIDNPKFGPSLSYLHHLPNHLNCVKRDKAWAAKQCGSPGGSVGAQSWG